MQTHAPLTACAFCGHAVHDVAPAADTALAVHTLHCCAPAAAKKPAGHGAHTPLMSASNAISGITVVGAIVCARSGESTASQALAFVGIVMATINVVGGYMVTDRMLASFKKKEK